MKKRILLTFLFLLSLAFIPIQAKVKLGVLDLRIQGDIDTTYREMLSDILRHELYETGSFTVIERDRISEILKEYGLIQSGLISDETAVEIGNLLKVDQIAFGSIGKVDNLYSMTIRLIDVNTGRLTASESIQKRCIFEDVATAMIPEAAQRFIAKNEENRKAFVNQRAIRTTPVHMDKSKEVGKKSSIKTAEKSLDEMQTSMITFVSQTGNCTIYWNDKKAMSISQPDTGAKAKGIMENIYPGEHMLKIFHNDKVWYDDIIKINEGESLIINIEPDEFIIKTRMATF